MGNSVSTRFCSECGAANETTDPQCSACGKLLLPDASGGDTSRYDLLLDRYQVLTTLGSGGFSSVYRARDTHTGNIVAIKQINLRGLNAAETIDATNTFNRELNALSGLDHRHVPRLYDHFQDRDHWYLVLEYFNGPTLETYLEERLAQGKPIGFDEAVSLGIQLCTVLDYLHTRYPPIIFRDLKPGNVICGPDGKLSLVDFGIARHFRSGQSRDTQLLGSPGYAAPEQYGRAQTSPRSDIYSLGILLYAMLSGSDPTHCTPDLSALDLSQYAGGAAMHNLLARMMAVDPAERPGSAREVAATLEAIKQREREQETRNTGRIWIAPTPQDYPTSSGSQQQLLLQYQPAPITLPARGRLVNRRNVMLGLGALAVAAGTGIGFHTLSTMFSVYPHPPSEPAVVADTYVKDADSVTGVAWSRDAQWIASCSRRMVRVWEVSDGQDLFTYTTSKDSNVFNGLAWSPNGVMLAVASGEQGVIVLNARHGGVLGNFRTHSANVTSVNGVAWSPDSTRIAAANSDKTVRVWDDSGSDIMTYQASFPGSVPNSDHAIIKAVAWSPNGSYIASGSSDGLVVTWNSVTDEHYIGFNYDNFISVNAVAWSLDSLYIASASDDATVHILHVSLQSGQPFVFTGHSAGVTAVAWSPDGKRIASADSSGVILIWDAFTGDNRHTYRNTSSGVSALAWSPDSRLIAAGTENHSIVILKDSGR